MTALKSLRVERGRFKIRMDNAVNQMEKKSGLLRYFTRFNASLENTDYYLVEL